MTGDQISRRDVARLLGVHVDTVTDMLHKGLGFAVISWGARGQGMRFSRHHVERWQRARDCRRDRGKQCRQCWLAMEDMQAVAEHLVETRHAVAGCSECLPPQSLMPLCDGFR